MWFQEIDSAGALVAGTIKKFPIIKESTNGFTPGSEEKVTDESGITYTLSSTGGEITFKGVAFRPRTKELIDFFMKNRDKTYLLIKVDNETTVHDKTGVWVYPYVKVAEAFELRNRSAEFNFSFSCSPYPGAAPLTVTIDALTTPGNPLLNLPAADRPASVAVQPGDTYAFEENP